MKDAVYQPPLIADLDDAEISRFVEEPFKPAPYSSISQFVERAVKDTSKAVSLVSNSDKQDGITLNKQESRRRHQSIRKKPEYPRGRYKNT